MHTQAIPTPARLRADIEAAVEAFAQCAPASLRALMVELWARAQDESLRPPIGRTADRCGASELFDC